MLDPDVQSLMAELEWVSTELQSDLNLAVAAPEQQFRQTVRIGQQRAFAIFSRLLCSEQLFDQ